MIIKIVDEVAIADAKLRLLGNRLVSKVTKNQLSSQATALSEQNVQEKMINDPEVAAALADKFLLPVETF